MQFGKDFERVFFKLSLVKPKYLTIIGKGFYTSSDIDVLHQLSAKFYDKFHETPTLDQMKLLVSNSKIGSTIDTDIIDIIYNSDLSQYDDDWLHSTTESWIKWRNFDNTLIDTIEYIKTTDVTPENADSIINKVKSLINDRNSITFNSDIGLDFFNPVDHHQENAVKISTGYNFLDRALGGGYDKDGTLCVYLGEQSIGKSIFLANDAANFVKMGTNTAVITAEMSAYKFMRRIGANLLNIPMSEYENKAQNKDLIKRKLENVGDGLTPPGQLFIKQFPTSQATVPDIEIHLKQIEEERKIKLGAVVIDYINILANYRNVNTENTYMKIKQIAEDLRAMGIRNGWLIVTATQINRCLALDTIVKHETKGDIEIKTLNVGDNILTDEGYSTVSNVYETTIQTTFKIKTKSGKEIRASKNHVFPVLDKNNDAVNKKVRNMKLCDKIIIQHDGYCIDEKTTKFDVCTDEILSINTYLKEETIDITVDNEKHLFFANGILTHNSSYNSTDLTLSDVAESAGLSHTADVMLGIIQDDIMRASYEYWVKILKIRDGEGKGNKCKLNINYSYMKLTETDELTSSNIHEL